MAVVTIVAVVMPVMMPVAGAVARAIAGAVAPVLAPKAHLGDFAGGHYLGDFTQPVGCKRLGRCPR